MSTDIRRINGTQFDRLIKSVGRYASSSNQTALDMTYQAILNGKNTTDVFKNWWSLASGGTKYDRLSRFARMLAASWSDKVYTLGYVETGPTEMTPLDDLYGRSPAQLCTDETDPVDDWADEDPMTWYIRANALSLSDGTMNVIAVEGVDPEFDIYGDTAPVYTFCLALWLRKWNDGTNYYKSWCTTQRGGYKPYAGDIAPTTNVKRDLTWRPTFPGGRDRAVNNKLGSGFGQKPFNRISATAGNTAAKLNDAFEGLWNDADTIWALDMWQLRHFNLENSDICNGCQDYNYQYTVALAEENASRVLLTSSQANNIQVGSNIMIGTHPSGTNTDRNTAANYDIADNATVISKEVVNIDGTDYTAINLDVSNLNIVSTAYVSTAPWNSGNTEKLPGHKDGACVSLTAGKNPMRIQGVEMMSGAYDIGLDPLYNVTNYASSKGDYNIFECKDSENLSGSITANYENTGIVVKDVTSGWNYIKDFVDTDKAILFPSERGGASNTYYKSSFYGTSSAGVRCPWRYGSLDTGAPAGLACERGAAAPGSSYWHGRPRLSGSGKKRGEWAT